MGQACRLAALFRGGCSDPSPIGKEARLVGGQTIGRKGVAAKIPDAVHPEDGVARVELLAERVKLHGGVVGWDDPFLHAARKPSEGCRELVALKEEVRRFRIDESVAVRM